MGRRLTWGTARAGVGRAGGHQGRASHTVYRARGPLRGPQLGSQPGLSNQRWLCPNRVTASAQIVAG